MLLPKQTKESHTPRKFIYLIKAAGLLCFLMVILEIWVVNRFSTFGTQIQQIQLAEENLKMENQVLENQISENSSLLTIEKKSFSLGFNTTDNLQYLQQTGLASAY